MTDLRDETYLPSQRAKLAKMQDLIRSHQGNKRNPAQLAIGPDDSVEIPGEVYRILNKVVDAMREGLAVTVVPRSETMTTQQAADMLGISRPTLIRLLDAGRIPYERVGTHRRLRLRDVLDYRENRREEQYRFLEETAVGPETEEDIDVVLDRLRQVRRARGSKR